MRQRRRLPVPPRATARPSPAARPPARPDPVSRARGRQMSKRETSACSATRTFSCAVSCGNTLVIWNDFAMPIRAKRCCGVPVMSRPSNRMRPALGGNAPEIRLKYVLLPAPFGPMIDASCPAAERRRDAAQRHEFAEALADVPRLEDRRRSSAQPRAATCPRCRAGRTARSTTNTTPTTSCQCTVHSDTRFSSSRNTPGADERPEERPHAAQQRHHHAPGRTSCSCSVSIGTMPEMQRLQRPGQAAERARQHEGQPPGRPHVDSRRRARAPRSPASPPCTAPNGDARMRDSTNSAAITNARDDVIARQRIHEVERARLDHAEPHAAQPVLAAGPARRLIRDVVDALRQRQRHHREVDAARPDRERAHRPPPPPRPPRIADQQPGPPRQPEMRQRDAAAHKRRRRTARHGRTTAARDSRTAC